MRRMITDKQLDDLYEELTNKLQLYHHRVEIRSEKFYIFADAVSKRIVLAYDMNSFKVIFSMNSYLPCTGYFYGDSTVNKPAGVITGLRYNNYDYKWYISVNGDIDTYSFEENEITSMLDDVQYVD